MKLHQAKPKFFRDTIRAAAQRLKIDEVFIEKDYWISLILFRLSKSKFVGETVFKGGTSLSKAFNLINRFSEDVDIAIINAENRPGNVIKNIIRSIEKEITADLSEIKLPDVTSKGSKFRKSLFEYDSILPKNKNNRMIVEINSFANPYPNQLCTVQSFTYDFLKAENQIEYIDHYALHPFQINVLAKEQTLLEKLVSLIRFSFARNSVESISSKIRHFYDLYYLLNDSQCSVFVETTEFKKRFVEIFEHDKNIFDEPSNWRSKNISESPLVNDFTTLWRQIKDKYKEELTALAYSKIPDEKEIAEQFNRLIKLIQ